MATIALFLTVGQGQENPPIIDDPLCADGDGWFPHESDCSLYYQCFGGNKFEFKCPDGLEFNPVALVCDYPELAGCTSIETTTLSDTTTVDTFSTTEAQPTENPTTTEKITTTAVPTTTAEPTTTPAPYVCPAEGVQYIPYPDNCSLYVHCVNGDGIVMECPPDLYFNPDTLNCDFPENVECTQ